MAKIKQKVNITDSESSQIRKVWDTERSRWYYSITDIMGVLTESVDARNYWKALKNRLRTTQMQLVMDCNQLKMKASDGKSYMVDTADSATILKIIQIIAPYNVGVFRAWFEHIEVATMIKSESSNPNNLSPVVTKETVAEITKEELSTTLEPAIDIYTKGNDIIVQIMLAGVSPDKIIIAVNMHSMTIKGERINPDNNLINKNDSNNYLNQELQWGSFYRQINFDTLIDVDNVEATENRGLINIKLPKIDQEKNRFIKIKNL
jgi:HSP20 family molecular chaperone IbpA